MGPSLSWEGTTRMNNRMSETTDPTTSRCAGYCQPRSRHRVLRRPDRSRHGMTLEQPRTDTAMSNTGEKISQAAAQRKAFAKSKVLNMLEAWETLTIFYLVV